jgi:hypothetical protein
MKKNFLLFLTLAFLLIITYVFQEKKSHQEFSDSITHNQVISSPILSLKLPAGEFIKRDERWYDGDKLLSHNLMKQIELKLTRIKRVKTITGGEWADYFPEPLSISVNHVSYTLGEMALDKKGFYIARDKSIMLARIEGESYELTTNEDEIEGIKLKELKSFLLQNKSAFYEKQLFRFYGNLPLEKAIVKMEDRLDYELGFKKNETLPPPVPGVSVHDKLLEKFLSLLTQVTIKDEISYPSQPLLKKLGSLKLEGDKDSLLWELWLRSDKSADVLILDPINKKAFEVIGGTVKIFFTDLQDFWDKKVIPQSEFRSFQRLPITLSQGTQESKVFIINSEPLRFESSRFKVQEEGMSELLRYLFNLPPHDQAQRISPLTKSERKQILAEDYLRIRIWDEEILVWNKTQEVILVNLTRGFKGHFLKRENSGGFGFKDVLK